jgi:hypothetical protein
MVTPGLLSDDDEATGASLAQVNRPILKANFGDVSNMRDFWRCDAITVCRLVIERRKDVSAQNLPELTSIISTAQLCIFF